MSEHRFLAEGEYLVSPDWEPFCILCGERADASATMHLPRVEDASGRRVMGGCACRAPYCRRHRRRLGMISSLSFAFAGGALGLLIVGLASRWHPAAIAVGVIALLGAAVWLWLLRRGGGISGYGRAPGDGTLSVVYADGRVPTPRTEPTTPERAQRRLQAAAAASAPAAESRVGLGVLLAIVAISVGVRAFKAFTKTNSTSTTPSVTVPPPNLSRSVRAVEVPPGDTRIELFGAPGRRVVVTFTPACRAAVLPLAALAITPEEERAVRARVAMKSSEVVELSRPGAVAVAVAHDGAEPLRVSIAVVSAPGPR
jgi:hypothetical protein